MLETTIALYFLSAVISLGLMFVFWRHRDADNWVWPSMVIALSTAVWAFGQAMELYVPTLEAKIFWGQLQYLGIVWLSPAWFVLAVGRTNGRKWLSHRFYLGLTVIPVITISLIFTNEWHHLMWSSVTLNTDFLFPVLEISYGAWFIVQTFYAIGLQFMGIAALVGSHGRHSKVYRQQNFLLLISLLLPISSAILRITGISFFAHVDVTPLLLAGSVSLLAIFTVTFRLFDVAPVARLMVLNNLNVGIVIISKQNRIVEINPAAQTMLAVTGLDMVGKETADLPKHMPALAPVCAVDTVVRQEIKTQRNGKMLYYDVEVSVMEDEKREASGRILTLTDITERKQIEATMRESERRYRLLADNATDIIWMLDTELNPTYISPSITRQLGYSVEEALAHTLRQRVPPSSLEKIMLIFAEARTAMKTMSADDLRLMSYTVEIENYHKDGSTIVVDIRLSFLLDQEGKPLGLLGATRNITARKEAEAAIAQQNEFLNTIIDSLANPFYVIDVEDYSIQIANKAARDLGVHTMNTCYALTHLRDTPCDGLEHPCPLVSLRNTKEPVIVEHIHFDANGNPRNMEVHAYPIFNDAGEVVQMIEYSLDVTKRKKAEAQFRQLSRAVEQSGSSIVITNLDGEIEFVNPAFTRTVGYTPEEVIGQNPRVLQSGQHPPQFYKSMWDVLVQGETWHGEMINRKKDRTLYWEHATISPITDTSGTITGYLAIKDDISDRKRTEAETKLLMSMSEAIHQAPDYYTALQAAITLTGEYAEWVFGEIWIPDDKQTYLVNSGAYYKSWDDNAALDRFKKESEFYTFTPNTGLPGRIWASHQSEWLRDISVESKTTYHRAEMAQKAGLGAMLGIPVMADGELLAVAVFYMTEPSDEDKRVVEVLTAVATQLGAALQQKLAQAALVDSEYQLRRLTDNISDFISQTDKHGILEYVSPSWIRGLGYTEEEVLGTAIFEYLHPDDIDIVFDFFTKLITDGASAEAEFRFRHKDDHYLYLGVNGTALMDEQNELIWAVFGATDITGRKQAEAETELLLSVSTALDDAPDFNAALAATLRLSSEYADWIFAETLIPNKEGTALLCSDAHYYRQKDDAALHEYAKLSKSFTFALGEGLPGRIWASHQSEWLRDIGVESKTTYRRAALAQGAGLGAVLGVPVMAYGELLAIAIFYMAEPRDEDERVVEVITAVAAQLGVALQQKLAQTVLVENEYQLRRLTDNISDFISQTDKYGMLEYISPSWTRGLGYTEEDVLGTSVFEYIHPNDVDLVFDLFAESITDRTSAEVDFRFRHKDGHYLHLGANGTVLMDAQGELLGAVFGATDITERKRAEDELKVAYVGIEEKVAELTAVNTLIQSLSRTTNLQEALNLVSRTMAEQLDSNQCRISLLNKEKTELTVAARYAKNTNLPDPVGISFFVGANIFTEQLFQTGQPIYIPHIQTNPNTESSTRQLMREQGADSMLLLPLLARGEMIGTIAVDSELPDEAFSDGDIRLGETIAAQIANTIANTRLSNEEKKAQKKLQVAYVGIEEKVEELTAVNTLIQSLSQVTNLEDALNLVTRTMVEQLNALQCGVALFNKEKTELTVAVQYSINADQASAVGLPIPLDGNEYTKRLFDTAKPVYIPRIQTNPDVELFTREIMRDQGVGSTLLLPLLAHGGIIGSIGIDSESLERAFTTNEIQLAETIAAQIANAIANARLSSEEKKAQKKLQVAYVGIEEKVEELTAVNTLIQSLSRSTNLQHALNIVTRTMVDQLDSFQCRIALLNQEKTALILTAQYSKSTGKLVSADTSIPLSGNLYSQRILETGMPVYIPHAQTAPDTEPSTRQLMQELGIGSILLLPLLASGEVIGTIAVDSELPDRAFSNEEILLAETIAAQIANAIANARLSSEEKAAQEKLQVAYTGIEEKVEELTAVNTLIQEMSRTTNLQEALNLVSRTMAEQLNSFQCGITLLNEKKTGMVVVAQYTTNSDRPNPIGAFFPLEGNTYTRRVFDTGKPIYMPNAQTSHEVEPFTRQIMREQGIGSTLLLPLLARGEVIGSIGIDSELPDRAFNDEEIRLAETIAAQVANAVANARLLSEQQKAKQTAEEANKAKSIFLANMSHELRTPMNAILGFAQLMQRDPEITPTQEERLQTIGRSGEHLLELINDVLEMSKIEAGRMELSESSFDLHKLLQDVISLLIMKAEEKNLSLDMQYPADLPQFIRTDEPKLRQVLINLIGNAIKFTKEGSIQVSVQHSMGKKRVSPRTTDTGFLQHQNYTLTFIVTDSGDGIDMDELATIFDPFIQAKNKRGQQGTGLGLPISRRFVQMMGGDMYVENKFDGGATFTFDIQAVSAAAGDVPLAEQLRQVVGLAAGQKTYRILLVEDNEENRALLMQLLEPIGFEVREAENGRVAINHAMRWKPDIILMDMRMPVMDGLEATRRIKAEQPDTPIIALTAGAFEHDRTEAIAVGCDDFMTKPVNIRVLFQLLERLAGVEFLYDDEKETALPAAETPLSAEDLTAVSPDLRQELHTAIIRADRRQAAAVIDEIRKENGRLADRLDALLKAFQFDQLAQLTG